MNVSAKFHCNPSKWDRGKVSQSLKSPECFIWESSACVYQMCLQSIQCACWDNRVWTEWRTNWPTSRQTDRRMEHHRHPWSHATAPALTFLYFPSKCHSPANQPLYNAPHHPTLPPAATHSKVILNNTHFNALQKLIEAVLFSLCSPLKGSCCRWCHMTWQQRLHSTVPITRITHIHTHSSSILSSSSMCQMKCDVRWELNPGTANQHIGS